MSNVIRDLGSIIQTSSEFKFKDFNIDQPNSPKGKLDEFSIEQSLINLFTWFKNTRIRRPDYGLNIRQFLYEPINNLTANQIGREIDDGIAQFEPRIQVDKITVAPKEDQNQYDIEIRYTIPSLPNHRPLKFATQIQALSQ